MANSDIITVGMYGLSELGTLPERMSAHFGEALILTMGWAADQIIKDAEAQLVPGHGYDTGLLHNSLVKDLVQLGLGAGVFYSLSSDAAEYWQYVEFGHLTTGGNWWSGYHYLGTAVEQNRGNIIMAAAEAWRFTASALSAESLAAISSRIVRII